MNKTDEELNLAEKMAKRYGVRMCDENGDTHGEELYCVGIDDIADIIREALAEQEKQEPVAYIRKDQLQRAMKYPCLCEISPEPRSDRVEIYAAQVSAKREWVDLTEGEQESIYLKCNTPSEYINAVIAAYKEKNK